MLSLFRNRVFLAVTAGHFTIDILNSVGGVLLAVLMPRLNLSYAQVGLALTLYTFAGSLSQPLFGWLADRYRGRQTLLAGIGVAWTASCYLLVAFAPNWWWFLPFFVLASLGSGLFHPIGTSVTSATHPERAATATAIFFFGGQVGLALGPIFAGFLLGWIGTSGLLPLIGLALAGAALLIGAPALSQQHSTHRKPKTTALKVTTFALIAFIVLVATRSSIQATYMAFLPTLFHERGWDSMLYGMLSGTFMLAAAIGNVYTGDIADRYGMRAATVWPLLLSVPAGLICLWAPTVWSAFLACAGAGLLIGGQHSVLVVHAQRLLPTGQGLAAGLILGFTFASGGLGTWLGGMAADQIGLLAVMQIITLLALPTALLALTLPGREPASSEPQPQPSGATAD